MSILKKLFGYKKSPDLNPCSYQDDNNYQETSETMFAAFKSDKRLSVIISLGDTGDLTHYDLLKYAIKNDPDIGVQFAALKRIHFFKSHPDLLSFLQQIYTPENRSNLEPYLSMALSRSGLISIEEFNTRINGG